MIQRKIAMAFNCRLKPNGSSYEEGGMCAEIFSLGPCAMSGL